MPLFRQQTTSLRHIVLYTSLLAMTGLLAACGETSPWKFGFVGGLSGRISDLGGPSRNAMLLAIEEANASGGIDGRQITALVKDDQQHPEHAVAAVRDLIKEQVDVIIGPVTSAMAKQVVPLANIHRKLMIGTTVTTNELSDLDDYFIRTISPTNKNVSKIARFLYREKSLRRYAGLYDLRNKSFTKSWIEDFDQQFTELGGQSTQLLTFASGNQQALVSLAEQLLENDPDLIVLVTNALDAALLSKLIRSLNKRVVIATSEWAGTERLIQLGGKHVENIILPQFIDRESKQPSYLKFRANYKRRFNSEPGFPGFIAYNATNVVVEALRENPAAEELKKTILSRKRFPGLQGDILINEYGDGRTEMYICQVINGHIIVVSR